MSRRPARLGLLALSLLALAGCGKLGDLERPGPMFGHAQTEARPGAQRQDPNRPVQTVDPRDQGVLPTAPPQEP